MLFNRLWATVYAVARNAALLDTTRLAKAGRLAWRPAWRTTSRNAPQRARRVAEEAQGRRPGVRYVQRISNRSKCYHMQSERRAKDRTELWACSVSNCHLAACDRSGRPLDERGRVDVPGRIVQRAGSPSRHGQSDVLHIGPSSGRTVPACRIATSRRATDRLWTNAGAWGPSVQRGLQRSKCRMRTED